MGMRKVGEKIPMDECMRRALVYLGSLDRRTLINASSVTYHIWPDTRDMRAQGAGLIGAKILGKLTELGYVHWESRPVGMGKFNDWGYRITFTGRTKLDSTPPGTVPYFSTP